MNSKRPTKFLSSLTLKAAISLLAIPTYCHGQQTESVPANWGDAKIRLHGDSTASGSDREKILFERVPTLSDLPEGPSVKSHSSLLDPRFRSFPKPSIGAAAPSPSINYPSTETQSEVLSENGFKIPAASEDKWVAPVTYSAPMPQSQTQDSNEIPPVVNPVVEQQSSSDAGMIPQDSPVVPQVGNAQPNQTELGAFDANSSAFEGLQGRVKIIVDEQTGKLRVIGSEADIAVVEAEIQKILKSTETEERLPARILLRYSASDTLAPSIQQIYNDEYAGRVGNAQIVPLASPNALLVFGSQQAIDAVNEIVGKIESDEPPVGDQEFGSFSLKHVSAADAKRRLEDYFSGGERGQAFPVGAWTVIADYRSNTVIVRGDAQVVEQSRLLIQAIDIDEEALSTKSVRVFQLQNAVAGDLTIILQDAINGALKNVPAPLQSTAQGGGIQPGQPAQDGNETSSEPAPSKLQLQTVGQGGKLLTSGLLFDVRITPDSASNSLIVRGPASAMPLIEELIRQLDRLPNAETQIKVFQIVNGDAEQLLTMLESIFGADDQNQTQTGGLAALPLQTASNTPGSALINLRFAVEQRTNSIIATGPAGDLQVVEDLLNRLDEDLRSRRETVVYRLSNSNVLDVEEAMNDIARFTIRCFGQ